MPIPAHKRTRAILRAFVHGGPIGPRPAQILRLPLDGITAATAQMRSEEPSTSHSPTSPLTLPHETVTVNTLEIAAHEFPPASRQNRS